MPQERTAAAATDTGIANTLLLLLQQNATHTHASPGEGIDPLTSTRHNELLGENDASGMEASEENIFDNEYIDTGPEQTPFTGHRHGEPTQISTDAKVDA